MADTLEHDTLDAALRRCGASWDAAQTHGLLTGSLAASGAATGFGWLDQVLEGTDEGDALRAECEGLLAGLFEETHRQLVERQSEFAPLLPDDADSIAIRTTALAHWCEGFLHGLVAQRHSEALKARLAEEPLAEIIKDMLELTRATVDDDTDTEADETAFSELVEYLRVAAQLAFEELATLRQAETPEEPGAGAVH